MTFVHPLLLAGLLLAGIPILLHLIMRQKPKRLPFPAFRFLLQKHRTNQRSLRLRHLILLALRIFLIVAMCLALAHPRLFKGVLPGEQPVAAVLLFDTSYSMEYTVAGKTRLAEAKERAQELLNELPPDSKVAILDSAEVGGEWSLSTGQARQRLEELKLRHANAPVNRQIDQAFRLFNDLDQDPEQGTDPLPRFLYVFSDRTAACWDAGASANQRPPEGVGTAFVDVGVAAPEDMAILKIEPEPPVVAAGNPVYIKVTVQAYGKAAANQVRCLFDNESTGRDVPIELQQPGRAEEIGFERPTMEGDQAENSSGGLKPGLHQVTVQLLAGDALPFNNVGYATFTVREGRRVLVVADEEADAGEWSKALGANPAFRVETKSTSQAEPLDLKGYAAICLIDVAMPTNLWRKLNDYVRAGGGLAIVPGGEGRMPDLAAYNDDKDAQELMPGRIAEKPLVVEAADKADTYWGELLPNSTVQNRFLEIFRRWRQRADIDFFQPDSLPWANRFFRVELTPGSEVLTHYANNVPALLERPVGRGRVLLFTTAFDERLRDGKYRWNNYNEGSFYLVVVNHAVGYLAGDTESIRLNYVCGQTVTVNLPAGSREALYHLLGPGLNAGESNLTRVGEQEKLIISEAKTGTPGNFAVVVRNNKEQINRITAYSLNSRPEESLLDQVPAEQIEKVLGPGSVVTVGYGDSLHVALKDRWSQPLDLLPWLLIAVLLVLAVENLLANKFYRKQPEQSEQAPP